MTEECQCHGCSGQVYRILDGKGHCRNHFRDAVEFAAKRFLALVQAGLTRQQADRFIRSRRV